MCECGACGDGGRGGGGVSFARGLIESLCRSAHPTGPEYGGTRGGVSPAGGHRGHRPQLPLFGRGRGRSLAVFVE